MKYQIDDVFVSQLFSHPSFQMRLKRFSAATNQQVPAAESIVEEICTMLTEEFKLKVEEESQSISKSHLQVLKEIDQIKSSLSLLSIHTEQTIKDRSLDSSILSKCQPELSPVHAKRQAKCGSTSFMSSFLFEEKGKEDLEELIGTRMASLTGDFSKFESSVEDRLRNVESSLTRKMESIYKTLTSVFQSINDLQAKFIDSRHPKDPTRDQPRRDKLQKTQEVRPKTTRDNAELTQQKNPKDQDSGSRRRSFMGFLKY